MKTHTKLSVVMLGVVFAGVLFHRNNWKTVSETGLVQYLQGPSTVNDFTRGEYYCGTKDQYHYFIVVRPWWLLDTRFRVVASGSSIQHTQSFNTRTEKWLNPFDVIQITNNASDWVHNVGQPVISK